MGKKTIYYATSNLNKFKVLEELIPDTAHFHLEQAKIDLFEEQIDDQEKIALAKAQQAWSILKKTVIVDDVGIYFDKYKNFPGTFTKFVYRSLGFDGIAKLLDEGDGLSFKATTVLIWGANEYKIFQNSSPGTYKKILGKAFDENAPFEDVFMPAYYNKSYLELRHQDPELFHRIFYRSVCMKELITYLLENPSSLES